MSATISAAQLSPTLLSPNPARLLSAADTVGGGESLLQHLFLLCCYGGAPFIDYFAEATAKSAAAGAPRHESLRFIDPTDWMAADLSGSLLNRTIHPEFLANHPGLAELVPRKRDIALAECDLYNLTFSSSADENLFHRFHGVFACRCPVRRYGHSCEFNEVEWQNVQNDSKMAPNARQPANTTPRKMAARIELSPTKGKSLRTGESGKSKAKRTLNKETVADGMEDVTVAAATRQSNESVIITAPAPSEQRISTMPPFSLQPQTLQPTIATLPHTQTPRSSTTFQKLTSGDYDKNNTSKIINTNINDTNNDYLNHSLTAAVAAAAAAPATVLNFSTSEALALAATVVVDGSASTEAEEEGAKNVIVSRSCSFMTYLLVFLLFVISISACFRMMRGCFCDCFGGFKNPFLPSERYDTPVDANALSRCIDAVRAHEQNEKKKYLTETRRPLISSVSESCPAYNPTVIGAHDIMPHNINNINANDAFVTAATAIRPARCAAEPSAPPRHTVVDTGANVYYDAARNCAPHRTHSPPPSYHSSNGSLNAAPGGAQR